MKICVLPGDGIGPEIVAEAVRVLRDYYEDSREDAFLMEYVVEEDEDSLFAPVNRIAQFEEK